MTALLPADVERIRADHAAYVKGWADARAQAREGTGATYAILAACRVADAVPAVLDELTALRGELAKALDTIAAGSELRQRFVDRALAAELERDRLYLALRDQDKRTPDEWLATPEFAGTRILDHDGWRGKDAPGWETPLDRAEFAERLSRCTVTRPVRDA